MAGCWPSSLFCVFMDRDEVEVHKDANRERSQYPAILTELAWSIKDLLYGIKNTEKMIFVLVYFRALKRKSVICKSDVLFSLFSFSLTHRFSRFLVPSRQRNHRKYFYCHGKYFAKETAWTSAKFCCGNKKGNISAHPTRVANQNTEFASSCPLAELAI